MVIVYTKPNCPNCTKTTRHLQKNGILYKELPITPEIMEHAAERNYKQAPIVASFGDEYYETWCGYQPHKIDALDQE